MALTFIRTTAPASYGSWTCPDCGSHTWVLQSQQAVYLHQQWLPYRIRVPAARRKNETIYSSGHSYSYGRLGGIFQSASIAAKAIAGTAVHPDYDYASHSMSYG